MNNQSQDLSFEELLDIAFDTTFNPYSIHEKGLLRLINILIKELSEVYYGIPHTTKVTLMATIAAMMREAERNGEYQAAVESFIPNSTRKH